MNDSERDGTGTNFKIGLLQHSLNGTSNFQEWNEGLVAGIEKQFGSKVANPFQNGSEPNFTMMKAPTNATSANKKAIKKANEETLKDAKQYRKDVDRAVAAALLTMSKDSLARIKRHDGFENIRDQDKLYNPLRFISLVKETHQLTDNFLVRQAKRNELNSMTQGTEEPVMLYLERVIATSELAFPNETFDQVLFMSTFIKNTNSSFKSIPTEALFDKNIQEYLQKIEDDAIPENKRNLFHMITFIEEEAVKHNHLMRNIRASPMISKTDSSSSDDGAVMLAYNGKNVKGDETKKNCTFCSLLPEDGSFKNINAGNHTDSNCFRRQKASELLASANINKMGNAGNNNNNAKSNRKEKSKPVRGRNDKDDQRGEQSRKRNERDGAESNNNKKRGDDEGNRNGAFRNQRQKNDNGRVFMLQDKQYEDDSDDGIAFVSEEDAQVLTAQNTLRGINNPNMFSLVIDNANDRNMIRDPELFIGDIFNLARPVKMKGVGNGTVTATKGGHTIFGTAIFTPEIGYNLLSHPQLIREGAIDSTRIKYIAPKFQGGLDSMLYPDIYGVMREFAPIPTIAVASNLYQHVIKVDKLKQAPQQMA